MRSEDFFVAGLCFWSNVGAPRLGAPCGVSGRGAPLILGYQKSGVTPAAYSARLGRASGAKDKFTEIKTVASGLRPVDVFCGSGLTSMFNKDTPKHETCVPCVGRVSTRHGRLKSALRHAILVGCGRCFTLKTVASGLRPVDVFCGSGLTSVFNKDTPKHETCVPCVGRVSTRHGRLKSALRHAILVGCGRCFTLKTVASGLRPVDVFCGLGLTSMFNNDTPKHEICVPCVGQVSTRHGRLKSALRHAILVGCGRCFTLKTVASGLRPVDVFCGSGLTSMFNKDTPKHETCVPCVGRVSTRHGRLKSALRHAILVGCGRCFTLKTVASGLRPVDVFCGSGLTSMFNKDTPKHETCVPCVGRVSTRHGRLKSALRHAILISYGRCFTLKTVASGLRPVDVFCGLGLTSMFNKDTPKHETCVPCVGRVSTRHGRLKSALRHAILVGCGRCFTLKTVASGLRPVDVFCGSGLTSMFNKDTPKHEICVPCVGRVSTRHGRLKSALRHAILVGCGRCFTLTHDTSSAVAGFGGRRFVVPHHEDAAKDCRCADSSKNALAANPNQPDHGRPTKALRDNATRKLTHIAH